jgi:hypothetical protein
MPALVQFKSSKVFEPCILFPFFDLIINLGVLPNDRPAVIRFKLPLSFQVAVSFFVGMSVRRTIVPPLVSESGQLPLPVS